MRRSLLISLLALATSITGCTNGMFDKNWDDRPARRETAVAQHDPTPIQRPPQSRPSSAPRRVYLDVGSEHWISKVIGDGEYVKLEDGSLWEISSVDRINSMLWLPVETVHVVTSSSSLSGYKIVNTDAGDSADATFVGMR